MNVFLYVIIRTDGNSSFTLQCHGQVKCGNFGSLDYLYCRYTFHFGNDWSIASGLDTGKLMNTISLFIPFSSLWNFGNASIIHHRFKFFNVLQSMKKFRHSSIFIYLDNIFIRFSTNVTTILRPVSNRLPQSFPTNGFHHLEFPHRLIIHYYKCLRLATYRSISVWSRLPRQRCYQRVLQLSWYSHILTEFEWIWVHILCHTIDICFYATRYGSALIPLTPGVHNIKVDMFAPIASSYANQFVSWLMGNPPEVL